MEVMEFPTKASSCPCRFAAVEHLSVTELQQLQANVSAMDDLILEVKDLLQQLKAVRQEGRSVADAIMDREPKLQEAAVDYEGKREALAQLRSSVEAKIQQRQEILQKRSPQRLGVQLNAGRAQTGPLARAQDAEQLAEETLNQALDAGAMDASGLSQFRQQFMQQKMKKHLNLALKSAVESGISGDRARPVDALAKELGGDGEFQWRGNFELIRQMWLWFTVPRPRYAAMGHPGAPSGVGGGNPGDAGAGASGASDQRAARERYRNALFDREAKAATALLEQVRHYVGRSGKCHVSDFEDLCTIHHAISNLYQRVRRFSNVEAMPRVYRNAVKGPAVGPNERPTAPTQNEAELLILNSDGLEAKAEDDGSAAVLGASTASVPLVALEVLPAAIVRSGAQGARNHGAGPTLLARF
ncbi:unnamed protein product [Cladocopium goreaui]|uniref:EF-hand domain-containing protein n=2 Tax=Cladocopium goreaui TaxID=2562237 RepID=A0A9P1GG79_9DINO|nr:unnamed protein product [Cladocopium goreaui]